MTSALRSNARANISSVSPLASSTASDAHDGHLAALHANVDGRGAIEPPLSRGIGPVTHVWASGLTNARGNMRPAAPNGAKSAAVGQHRGGSSGASVAVAGDALVVGASGEDDGRSLARVFRRGEGLFWCQILTLAAERPVRSGNVGSTVSVSGTWLAPPMCSR